MKKIITFLILLVTTSAFAKESIALSPINFQVMAEDALSKFEQTVLYPEGLLKRFHPVGAKISNKRISHNVISFVATRKILLISKSVFVNGILEASKDNQACSKGDVGYRIKMQFDSSDALVTDNVEELQALICLRSQSKTTLVGNVKAKVITGNNYSSAVGAIAVNLIKEQVSPLIDALTKEIKSLR